MKLELGFPKRKLILKLYLIIILLAFIYFNAFSFWIPTNGPEGGEIRSILINKDTIFAGSFSNGLYYSSNKGKEWKAIAFENNRINQIKFFKNRLFVGIGTKEDTGGLFVSTNNGITWEIILKESVITFDIFNNILIACTYSNKMLISYNLGKSWYNFNFPGGLVYSILITENNIIVGTEANGIFVSSDLGVTWEQRNNGLNCLIIWCIAQKDTTWYIGTGGGGIFSTSNNGETWIAKNSGILHPYVLSILFIDTLVFAGTVGGGLYISLNKGNFWFKTNLSYESVMCLATEGNNLYVGTQGSGIYFSSDYGITWRELNRGIICSEILCLASKGDTLFAGTNGGGLHISYDFGKSWYRTAYRIRNNYVKTIAFKDSTIYVGTLGGGFYLTTDNGENWKQSYLKTYEINVIFPYNDLLFIGTNHNGLFILDFDGDSLLFNYFKGETITGICNYNDKIFIASKSNGISIWEFPYQIPSKITLQNYSVTSLTSNIFGILAGTDDGDLFLSTDSGNSWKIIASNNFGSVVSIKSYKHKIIASWETKNNNNWIIASFDSGKTWGVRTKGLENKRVASFTFTDSLIFVGTFGFGVYKSSTDTIFSSKLEKNTSEIVDFEVFPNPVAGDFLFIKIHDVNFKSNDLILVNILGIQYHFKIDSNYDEIFVGHLPKGINAIIFRNITKLFIKQ
ncbi:MAG: hypothetical protein N2560_05825 [Ignavibacteria bacterium]|nr:hypothetical protein [Ignavibacteria bacterium]